MDKSEKPLPIGFRIEVKGDFMRLSALGQSPRGTRYIQDQVKISKAGKTKEQFTQEVEDAIFKMNPGYPRDA